MTPHRPDYLRHRIQRAFETLNEAELLLSGMFTVGVVNRIYYACFYAVSALLASEGHSSSKHSGVMSLFDQHWVKPGRVTREIGAFYHLIFERRHKGDYEDGIFFDRKDVEGWLAEARSLVEFVADWLRANAGTEV